MDNRETGPLPPDQAGEAKPAAKKKKSTTQLGGFALAPRKSAEKADAIDTAWSKLTLTKRRAGQTVETIPVASIVAEKTTSEQSEITQESRHESLDEALTPEETGLVEWQIATERQGQEAAAEDIDDESEDFIAEAAEAVERFRARIIEYGQQAEEAFTETLAELEVVASPAAVVETEDAEQPMARLEPMPPDMTEEKPREVVAEDARDTVTREIYDSQLSETESTVSDPAQPSVAPVRSQANRRPSPLAPAATALSPRGSGIYRLNTFARKDGQPSTEYVPLHDELSLKNLPGGIVGYLIGRRRGRLKTEKKMASARKKLEAQVNDLQESIIAKENHIKEVVRMNKRESYKAEAARLPGQESLRSQAPEANQLHSKKPPVEQIGHVLITSEGREPTAAVKKTLKASKEKSVPKLAVDKRVATMSRAELLETSEKAEVNDTTLRRIYEAHLVNEQGLRRLMSEYVRGADLHEALREELVEHEIDFERDPQLRGHFRQPHNDDTANDETLDGLLAKAGLLTQADKEDELAVLKARQTHHEQRRHRQQSHRRVMDVSMVAAITVLFILVVILLAQGR